MGSGLIKFASRVQDGGERGNLYWKRALQDGAPYRGRTPPNYTQEEFENNTVRVADPKNGTFYTGDPKQNVAYLDVLDKISNGWGALVWVERRYVKPDDPYYTVSIEWLEYFLEDGTPTQQGIAHGQQNIPGPIG